MEKWKVVVIAIIIALPLSYAGSLLLKNLPIMEGHMYASMPSVHPGYVSNFSEISHNLIIPPAQDVQQDVVYNNSSSLKGVSLVIFNQNISGANSNLTKEQFRWLNDKLGIPVLFPLYNDSNYSAILNAAGNAGFNGIYLPSGIGNYTHKGVNDIVVKAFELGAYIMVNSTLLPEISRVGLVNGTMVNEPNYISWMHDAGYDGAPFLNGTSLWTNIENVGPGLLPLAVKDLWISGEDYFSIGFGASNSPNVSTILSYNNSLDYQNGVMSSNWSLPYTSLGGNLNLIGNEIYFQYNNHPYLSNRTIYSHVQVGGINPEYGYANYFTSSFNTSMPYNVDYGGIKIFKSGGNLGDSILTVDPNNSIVVRTFLFNESTGNDTNSYTLEPAMHISYPYNPLTFYYVSNYLVLLNKTDMDGNDLMLQEYNLSSGKLVLEEHITNPFPFPNGGSLKLWFSGNFFREQVNLSGQNSSSGPMEHVRYGQIYSLGDSYPFLDLNSSAGGGPFAVSKNNVYYAFTSESGQSKIGEYTISNSTSHVIFYNSMKNLLFLNITTRGLLLCNKTNAILHSLVGTQIWNASMPMTTSVFSGQNAPIITSSGQIILSDKFEGIVGGGNPNQQIEILSLSTGKTLELFNNSYDKPNYQVLRVAGCTDSYMIMILTSLQGPYLFAHHL